MPGPSFRFLHTADWQIGMRASGLGDSAERVRQVRLQAAERVIEVAREQRVECMILAGDTFEDNSVDPVLAQKVADILDRAPCPVFILPGNHDPLTAGSVYDREMWKRTRKVTVWREPVPMELREGVVLYPCPSLTRRREDPTAWIPARTAGDESIRIGIAHGTLQGFTAEDDESAAPISPQAVERAGLDYLALGHWHSTFLLNIGLGVRTAYAGTHETTRFGERDSGNVLVIEVVGRSSEPRIQKVHTGILTWRQERREIRSGEDLAALLQAYGQEASWEGEKTLLELTVSGVAPAEVLTQIQDDLMPMLHARFLYARLITDDLLIEPTEDEILAIAPAGPIRAACERLLQISREADDLQERSKARLALLELYALSKGAV